MIFMDVRLTGEALLQDFHGFSSDGKQSIKNKKHMVQVAYIVMFWDTNVLPRKSALNLSKFHSGQVIIFLQTANTFTKAWILLSS